MIGRLKHVAIAVPDLQAASALYCDVFGAKASGPIALPEHGVMILFIDLPNTRIELMAPLGEHSPIGGFLAKRPSGGLHHICFEVEDIYAVRQKLLESGTHILGDGIPKIGAHGKQVLFLDPRDCAGTLIEIEES